MKRLTGVFTEDLTDTKGALLILTARQGREYSRHTLQYHVRQGNLPAYVFIEGNIVRWEPDAKGKIGVGHLFVKADVQALPLDNKAGRKPKSTKDEFNRFSKTALKTY